MVNLFSNPSLNHQIVRFISNKILRSIFNFYIVEPIQAVAQNKIVEWNYQHNSKQTKKNASEYNKERPPHIEPNSYVQEELKNEDNERGITLIEKKKIEALTFEAIRKSAEENIDIKNAVHMEQPGSRLYSKVLESAVVKGSNKSDLKRFTFFPKYE